MDKDALKKVIDSSIENLKRNFKEHPGIFLSESDMKCHLFRSLSEYDEIFNPKKSRHDDRFSVDLHTEIRWYGQSKKLRLLSDLVVLDAEDLRTTEVEGLKLPSK